MTPAHSHAYDALAGETMRSANACEDRSKRTKEGEGCVDEVYIRFISGTSIRFRARGFDISLGRASQEDKSPGGSPTKTSTAGRPRFTSDWTK